MATLLFFLTLILYAVGLSILVEPTLFFIWIPLSVILGFFSVIVIYLLQLPLVMILPANNSYKNYLMKSMSFFILRIILRQKTTHIYNTQIPKTGRLVVYANHKSYTDGFAVLEMFPRPITLSPKHTVLKIPFLRLWLKSYAILPIYREDPRKTLQAIQNATKTIQNELPILLFPEGTIKHRHNTEINEMKAGSFRLAQISQADILLLYFEGNDLVKQRWPKTTNRNLTVLSHIPYEDYKDLSTKEIRDLVQSKYNTYKKEQ